MRRPPRSTLFPSTTLFRSHALNRLAYGPRPGEVARVAREGVMRWIDRQLAPDQIADGDRAAREREFRVLHYDRGDLDRKSTRLNSSHGYISYAVFCLKKKKKQTTSSPT